MGMVAFFERVMGVLSLDASIYENVEADRRAGMQSVIVVLAACLAGGVAAMGLGLVGWSGFLTGAIVVLGAWLVWVGIITTVHPGNAWPSRFATWPASYSTPI